MARLVRTVSTKAEPLFAQIWAHIKSLKPSFISKNPHFNFITIHYFWIIGMAIFGSICLYPHGGIAYIDALFLASGSATQSGLNTVNINQLNTWQQLVLYIIPMFCNPITINTFVVFMRLYWFEKRFQHIVKESKKNRRSISKSFSKSKTTERDIGNEEMGVNGRDIVVMRGATNINNKTDLGTAAGNPEDDLSKEEAIYEESNESGTSRDQTSTAEEMTQANTRPQTQIKFADTVKRSNGEADEILRMPDHRTNEDHIAILERQRNQDDGAVLRIPGPRDADAGIGPQTITESSPVEQTATRRSSSIRRLEAIDTQQTDDTHLAVPRNITFTEPTRSPVGERVTEDFIAAKHVLSPLRLRKPRIFKSSDEKLHEAEPQHHLRHAKSRTGTFQSIKSYLSQDKTDTDAPYFSWQPTVGRNSVFFLDELNEAQRDELGGIEYRSLKSLATILTIYFWGFTAFGVICLVPWLCRDARYKAVVEQDGQGKVWWGIFTSSSAFNDVGYTLTPDSMQSFQEAIWPLLLMSFLIVIGNTGFPIMLRFIIWVTSVVIPKTSGLWEELRFLLDHPRRCFTLMFPSKPTWYLFAILIGLNGLDLVFFIVLDLGNTVVTSLPVNIRVLDGWFQAVSTRTAGFGVVNLAELHPAIQVSYLVMMYISVLPIAISVRRTNVYEEKALGIYGSPAEENEDENEPSYVGAHLRRQLSFDLWYIFLGVFIIAIAEGSRIQSGDPYFTLFSVLFEVVSAYGTVGLSLGYLGIDASFSAEFSVISKLVIIAMQIRGRHRGLPYELDRAIVLPNEDLDQRQAEEAALRMRRRSSMSLAPVSEGAAKTERSVSRNMDPDERQTHNFLGALLHAGPPIPSSYRNLNRNNGDARSRRHSIAIADFQRRKARSVSPRALNAMYDRNPSFGIPLGDERRGRPEGRRTFYKEGVNPAPGDTAA